MKVSLLAFAVAMMLFVPGCGGDEDDSGAEPRSTAEGRVVTTQPGAEGAVESNAFGDAKPTWVRIDKRRPKVTVPEAPPPRQLVIRDLESGSGPPAEAGDEVTIMYLGRYYETGKLFSASWDWGEPTTFKIGAGAEGEGWEQGLKGMRVGGRRELIVPSRMTTPDNVNPTVGVLLYVIDLFAIT